MDERQDWELSESEFTDRFAARWHATISRRSGTPENRRWLDDIAARADRFRAWAARAYRQALRAAVRRRLPVPEAVLAQDPAFRKIRDDYAAYLKGRETSFANVSAGVDFSTREALGCKVKRQDGRPVTDAQKEEIGRALSEFGAVFGSSGVGDCMVRDALRRVDATVSHTSGKHPFLRDSGGLYVPSERTISFGTRDRRGRAVKAFAHELAHLLDAEAGRRAHPGRPGGPYLSEAGPGSSFLAAAVRRMNVTEWSLDALARLRPQDVASEDEKVAAERRRLHLGPYWRRPREVFARLVEQFVSESLGRSGLTSAEADYEGLPGWWSREVFSELEEEVGGMVYHRLDIILADRPAGRP